MHVCFHNTLTDFELNVNAEPNDTLHSVIEREVLKYNLNAFAYQLKTSGEIVSLDRTIASICNRHNPCPDACPKIFMIFPDSP